MADVVVTDDIKRGINQLRLIADQLLGGVLDPVTVRPLLHSILEHRNPMDVCECGHIRGYGKHCGGSITERHHGRIGMRGATVRPCPCTTFRPRVLLPGESAFDSLHDEELGRS